MHVAIRPVIRAGHGPSRGAIARYAYLAAERVETPDGRIIDYRRKNAEIEFSALFSPAGEVDPASFWRSVDAHPVRVDAKRPTVARDMVVAIPHELDRDSRIAAVSELCDFIVDKYGVAVHAAIHVPTKKMISRGSDERNVHAHLLISERVVGRDGKLGTINRDFNNFDCRRRDRKLGRDPRENALSKIRKRWDKITRSRIQPVPRDLDLTPKHDPLQWLIRKLEHSGRGVRRTREIETSTLRKSHQPADLSSNETVFRAATATPSPRTPRWQQGCQAAPAAELWRHDSPKKYRPIL